MGIAMAAVAVVAGEITAAVVAVDGEEIGEEEDVSYNPFMNLVTFLVLIKVTYDKQFKNI